MLGVCSEEEEVSSKGRFFSEANDVQREKYLNKWLSGVIIDGMTRNCYREYRDKE